MDERTRALIFTSVGHLANDSYLILFPVLIAYYLDMGLQPMFLSAAATAVGILSGALSSPVGAMADRRGNYVGLMALGISLLGAASAVYALSFAFMALAIYSVVVGSVLLGFGLSFYHQLGASILQIKYGADAPKALGLNGSMGSLGRAIFPSLVVLAITLLGGFRGLLVASAYGFALAAITYAGLSGMKVEPRARPSQPAGEGRGIGMGSAAPYLGLVAPLVAIVFVRAIFFTGVTTYVPSFMAELYRSKIIMSVVLTVSYGTAIFGQPLFGRWTTKYGGRAVVIATTVLPTLVFPLFLLARDFYLQVALFAVYSFLAMSGFPVLLGYVGQLVEQGALARANALVWGVGNLLGGAIGSLIGGPLMPLLGLGGLMWVYFAFAVASTAMLVALPRSRSRSKTFKVG